MTDSDKIFSKAWFRSYILIFTGTLILATGMVFFIAPHKLVPGGLYGISIVIHYLLNTPIGLIALCMDVPLLIMGIRLLGKRFGIKTFVSIVLTAVFVDLLGRLWGNDEPLVKDDVLLSSLFGGALLGFGIGLIFKTKATSGGTDILAMILHRYLKIPVGRALIYIDSLIVLMGLVVFQDWKIPLYSWLVIFITGKVIDTILEGLSVNKVVIIISDRHEAIREKILFGMDRGGTYLNAEGMYEGREKKIIYTNINRRELSVLLSYIREIDPTAFVSVIDAHDVLGEGFKPLQQ
ncbi:MAG: YitT family protein [Bacteroidales bacterium]|jgi:uncharacterized membrane-anchored protein YitT (DUF2179 family)|nr:YitT family protein [Bacteroidales bacterium]